MTSEGSVVHHQCPVVEPNAKLFNMQQVNAVPRMLKIKQEPFINVKQEIVESARVFAQPGVDFVPDSDAFCEFCDAYFINNVELKNHIVKYHSNDSENDEIPNNCEIMEIITLENAFINLAEEDNGGERHDDLQHSSDMIPLEQVLKVEHLTEYEQREQREQSRQTTLVLDEHCYSRLPEDTNAGIDLPLESTPNEFQYDNPAIQSITTFSEPIQSYQQTILDPELPSLYQCLECSQQFTCQTLLDEHIPTHRSIVSLSSSIESNQVNNHSSLRQRRLRSVKCKYCTKRFASNSALAKHHKTRCRHQSRRTAFRCRICRRLFAKVSRLRMHESNCAKANGKKAMQERVRKMECNKVGGRYACSLCDQTYGRRSNFVSEIYCN